MPSPYPGMDPYLEEPGRWPDVHHELISIAREILNVQLRPKYIARVEERIYLADDEQSAWLQRIPDIQIVPRHGEKRLSETRRDEGSVGLIEPIVARTLLEDVEIHEARLQIIHTESREVVTVIELLSPSNKIKSSNGWVSFEQKRAQVMLSECHWVEIDLLREGSRVRTMEPLPPCEYLVHVSRAANRPDALIWPIRLSQRLPIISIPLKPEDPDTTLDLQAVLNTAYDRAGYDLDTDYSREPAPPLPPEWAEWSDTLLKSKGLRPS